MLGSTLDACAPLPGRSISGRRSNLFQTKGARWPLTSRKALVFPAISCIAAGQAVGCPRCGTLLGWIQEGSGGDVGPKGSWFADLWMRSWNLRNGTLHDTQWPAALWPLLGRCRAYSPGLSGDSMGMDGIPSLSLVSIVMRRQLL